ncbi:Glu/Leu/Phe/Val dehydrogenase [Candidatus Paraluminiphilus aquimaris]|uniref:Glu/Leu/Phe/Val dehydrogenase n=1 Tax=Candidatus Paraluminiphilus aquimaris TaxID=2518994 RepID=A0ABY6Q972_9GAMM|nr:Glu/Leu/Phe/Val dehydrogenase dimerization domain-containing protein [Candidatus Paraluminiphilus aquimaris]UZP74763.1 Glu/Leu/Phe/Val dehydrogenase [Candidatus Paraluminiphilus aquimaris]
MNTFTHPEFSDHERVVFVNDKPSGLRAIIAVHNTTRGSAMGGCRMWPYDSADAALTDVLRLSRGMTYKNALAGISSGGGKSVIIGNPKTDKTPRLFQAMGEAIASLGGRYIAAEDSGTTPADMAVMAESTQFVAGLDSDTNSGDPSPSTALGVFLSIREAVRFRFNESALTGLRVNIQGLGKVGYELARLLIDEGVAVTASDINDDNCIRANETLGVKIASNSELMNGACEVFAPCALGGVINQWSIPTLNTAIVAGAANNQLLTSDDHQAADRAGILYCPDYLINAGGVIDVYHRRQGASQAIIDRGIADIPDRLRSVLEEAKSRGMSAEAIAQERAEQLISAALLTPKVTEAA